jgi:hypothetical protein
MGVKEQEMQRKEAKKLERQVPTKGRSFWSDGAESNDTLHLWKKHREDTVGLRTVRTAKKATVLDPITEEPLPEKNWRVIRGVSTNAVSFKHSAELRSSSEPDLEWEDAGFRVACSARQHTKV